MKIFYIRKDKTKSKGQYVVTVMHELNPETRRIKIAYSICTKKDQFEKWKGKYYARQRFDNIGNSDASNGFKKFSCEQLYVGKISYNAINEAVKNKVLMMIKQSGLNIKLGV